MRSASHFHRLSKSIDDDEDRIGKPAPGSPAARRLRGKDREKASIDGASHVCSPCAVNEQRLGRMPFERRVSAIRTRLELFCQSTCMPAAFIASPAFALFRKATNAATAFNHVGPVGMPAEIPV
jgi:hypothetical protein